MASNSVPQSEWEAWEKKWPVLDPSKRSPLLERWEVVMLVVLVFTSILAPFETALRQPEISTLLIINLVVNVIFFVDMVLQFLTAFPDTNRDGRYVKRPREIVKRYVTRMFIFDLLATIPVDLVIIGIQAHQSSGNTGGGGVTLLRTLRLFRLIRMLKLSQLGALVARWQAKAGINFSTLTMIKLFFLLVECTHWTACVWCFVGTQTGQTPTWITGVLNAKDPTSECIEASKNLSNDDIKCQMYIYVMAMYWAIMTTTTIGYGDINPFNLSEYSVACFCEVFCALCWAVILGEVCTIVATLAPHEIQFKRTMDDLNRMMEDQHMPSDLRRTLRNYFHYSKRVRRYIDQQDIVDQMSPMLQGTVSMHLHSPWLDKVAYLQGLPTDTVVSVSRRLHPMVLAPQEEVRGDERRLYIIVRGVCVVGVRVKSSGECWGEDMVLENVHLREQVLTRALSFMELLTIGYDDLMTAIQDCFNPHEGLRKIQWARAVLALRRGIVKIARALKNWEFRNQTSSKKISEEELWEVVTLAVEGRDVDGMPLSYGANSAFTRTDPGDEDLDGPATGLHRSSLQMLKAPGGRASMRAVNGLRATAAPVGRTSMLLRSTMAGGAHAGQHKDLDIFAPSGRRTSIHPGLPRGNMRRSMAAAGPIMMGGGGAYAGGCGQDCDCYETVGKLIQEHFEGLKAYIDARLEEKFGNAVT